MALTAPKPFATTSKPRLAVTARILQTGNFEGSQSLFGFPTAQRTAMVVAPVPKRAIGACRKRRQIAAGKRAQSTLRRFVK